MAQQSSRRRAAATTTSRARDCGCGNCVRDTDRSPAATDAAGSAMPYSAAPGARGGAALSQSHGHAEALEAAAGKGPRSRVRWKPAVRIASSTRPLASVSRAVFVARSASVTATPSYRATSKRTSVAVGSCAVHAASAAAPSSRTAKLSDSGRHFCRAVPCGSAAPAIQFARPVVKRACSAAESAPGVVATYVTVSVEVRLEALRGGVCVGDGVGVDVAVGAGLGVGEGEGEGVGVREGEGVAEGPELGVGERDVLGVGDSVPEGEGEGAAVGVRLAEGVGGGVGPAVRVWLTVERGEGLEVGVPVADGGGVRE